MGEAEGFADGEFVPSPFKSTCRVANHFCFAATPPTTFFWELKVEMSLEEAGMLIPLSLSVPMFSLCIKNLQKLGDKRNVHIPQGEMLPSCHFQLLEWLLPIIIYVALLLAFSSLIFREAPSSPGHRAFPDTLFLEQETHSGSIETSFLNGTLLLLG